MALTLGVLLAVGPAQAVAAQEMTDGELGYDVLRAVSTVSNKPRVSDTAITLPTMYCETDFAG